MIVGKRTRSTGEAGPAGSTTKQRVGVRKIRLSNATLPSWLVVATVGSSLGMCLVVWAVQRHAEVAFLASLCGWVPWWVRRGVICDNDFALEKEGRLRSFPEGIVFDGRLVVASKAIGSSYFIPRLQSKDRAPAVVRVVGPTGRVLLDVVVRDHADANTLLAHFRADAGQKRAIFFCGAQLGVDRARRPILGVAYGSRRRFPARAARRRGRCERTAAAARGGRETETCSHYLCTLPASCLLALFLRQIRSRCTRTRRAATCSSAG